MKPRRVDVDRMRRYQERTRVRYAWSEDERQELLDAMLRRCDELRAEDEWEALCRPRVPTSLPGVLYIDDDGAVRTRAPRPSTDHN